MGGTIAIMLNYCSYDISSSGMSMHDIYNTIYTVGTSLENTLKWEHEIINTVVGLNQFQYIVVCMYKLKMTNLTWTQKLNIKIT